MAPLRPTHRGKFDIAIICALPLEYDAVSLTFDELWDEDGNRYGRATGDTNHYTTGRIGKHNVVLALLPQMGKASAASAVASLRSSFDCLKLALLVGICAGVPRTSGGDEILLGDVIISSTVVPYDFGRQYPDGFKRKETVEYAFSAPNKDIRNLLVRFKTDHVREQLKKRTVQSLNGLQDYARQKKLQEQKYAYPGVMEDKLFVSSYLHKHHIPSSCICDEDDGQSKSVCDEARSSFCTDLGCDEARLVTRDRLQAIQDSKQDEKSKTPGQVFHIGAIAPADTVMKSGENRDKIAKSDNVIAFEMEGAGIWEEVPCIIVKGVCDYADCHKNKKWQNFAAAIAASASKAILEQYTQTDRAQECEPLYSQTDKAREREPQSCSIVPFGRNAGFIGREFILQQLLKRIPPSTNMDDCQRTAIEGLGGIGKTQKALEAAYRVRDEYPDCSIFWVPAVDATSFENAYRKIGEALGLQRLDNDKEDVKSLVQTALSQKSAGSWLLIIDNADDKELVSSLSRFLPSSPKGSILFTTRNHTIVSRLDIPPENVEIVGAMSRDEALEMLKKNMRESQWQDTASTTELLNVLADLPLAIRQASAYIFQNNISTTKYLQYHQSSNRTMNKLLSRDFKDRGRYENISNPITTTWLISFEHISRDKPLAAQYLRFICFLAEKDIPVSLLPPGEDELEEEEAIGTLRGYAFIAQRNDTGSFDIHRLVGLAMRNWLKEAGERQEWITKVIQRLKDQFPFPKHENRRDWIQLLPHTQAALEYKADTADEEAESYLIFNIAQSYSILGKYDEAEQMHRQTLELREKVLGSAHPSTIRSRNHLTRVLQNGRNHEIESGGRERRSKRQRRGTGRS